MSSTGVDDVRKRGPGSTFDATVNASNFAIFELRAYSSTEGIALRTDARVFWQQLRQIGVLTPPQCPIIARRHARS